MYVDEDMLDQIDNEETRIEKPVACEVRPRYIAHPYRDIEIDDMDGPRKVRERDE